jgi:hypothetical protein
MSHSFKTNSAKSGFSQIKEPTNAGDYITKKRIKNSFCTLNSLKCPIKPCFAHKFKAINYSDYIIKNKIKNSFYNPYTRDEFKEINKNQLYINLITKLQLNNDIPVIIDNSDNSAPALIDQAVDPTTRYTIDPSGLLFGNDTCTINNWQNYVVPNYLTTL